ncbi:hypothetical protein EDM02_03040 [Candidatus Cardinium hertigii]|uniref:VUT family protein n=1 Tax=Candidatus Cardinium hertigii TaxID=247481 RepID=A0A3N2QC65_9BACT|nr:hypothetical protein EDM02_03040 [Candidatus Cardinium hertigii]
MTPLDERIQFISSIEIIMDKNINHHNNIYNNIFYVIATSLLFAFTLSINFSIKIVYCALCSTFLALTVNCLSALWGSKKATLSVIGCVGITFCTLYDMQYHMYGKPIQGLITISLLSICISSCMGLKIFLKLKTRYSFPVSNIISSCVYAFVDGFIMAIFFINKFPIHSVFAKFYQEIAYKGIFGLAVYLLLLVLFYFKRIIIKYFRAQDRLLSRSTYSFSGGYCNRKQKFYKRKKSISKCYVKALKRT